MGKQFKIFRLNRGAPTFFVLVLFFALIVKTSFITAKVLCERECLSAKTENVQYPVWFYEQDIVPCENVVVVMSKPVYPDSVLPYLKRMGAVNLLYQRELEMKGKQSYTSSGYEMFWVESHVSEKLDTARYFEMLPKVVVLDYENVGQYLIGLVGMKDSCPSKSLFPLSVLKRSKMQSKAPCWVQKVPFDARFYYALGSSQGGVYEESAWDTAEKNARIELAKQKSKMKTQSLQKYYSNDGFQETGFLTFDVRLNHVQFLKRWKDGRMNVYYVLAKMNKD